MIIDTMYLPIIEALISQRLDVYQPLLDTIWLLTRLLLQNFLLWFFILRSRSSLDSTDFRIYLILTWFFDPFYKISISLSTLLILFIYNK